MKILVCRKYQRWRCSKLFNDFLHVDIMHIDIRHVLHMNSTAGGGSHNRELHGYLHGHCVLDVIKYRERAHNTHLHIVCRILCILTHPREI
jgi:hypothetical protein